MDGKQEIVSQHDGQKLPPLIFLHGSGDSARCWARVIALLQEYDCLALDLPGHGARRDQPGPAAMSVADYADDVRSAVMGHMGVNNGGRRVCLVGHSLGSAIAMRLAVDVPDLVSHVVLVGAGARLRVLPALLEEARAQPARARRTLVEVGFAPGHTAEAERYLSGMLPVAEGVLHRDLAACDAFDMMSEMSSIRQPTLVVVGDADRLTPSKYAAFLRDSIASANLVTIPDSGHYVPYEAPNALAAMLRAWLQAHP